MAYQHPEPRKFLGLHLQQNSFEVPDGAMEKAENVIIKNDDEIHKFPGFYTLDTSESIYALFKGSWLFDYFYAVMNDAEVYQIDTLSTLADNQTANFNLVPGESFSLDDQPPLGANRSFEIFAADMNQTTYIVTGSGPFRIDSTVQKAGIPPGLDLTATSTASSSGTFSADSQSSWRVLFGRKDSRDNLLLGAPSDIATIVLQPGQAATYTAGGVGPYGVVASTPIAHGLLAGDTITVTGGSDADVNGTRTVLTVVGATNFTFNTAGDPGASGTFNFTYARDARLEFSIPDEISDATLGYFVRVYRTSESVSADATPTPDFRLIAEVPLTQDDLDAGLYFFNDDVLPITFGPELYTNPNSQEGELQANRRPPLARDLCVFKNYMFYANISDYTRLQLQLVDPAQTPSFVISYDGGVATERFAGNPLGVGNRTVKSTSVSGAGTLTITYNAHYLDDGETIYVSNVTGTVPEGEYVVSGSTLNTFQITPGGILTATALDFQGVFEPYLATTQGTFYIDTSSASLAQQIETTARMLVKAINRFSTRVYANYISTPEDLPGKIVIEKILPEPEKDFALIATSFSSGGTTSGFVPELTLDTDIIAQASQEVGSFAVSKFGEPEAVAILSRFPMGSKNKEILRSIVLQDAVIFIKEDGIYKCTGDTLADFTVSPVDTSVVGLTRRGCAIINNRIMAMTSQGISEITSGGVQVVSRRIDALIQPLTGPQTNQFTTAEIQDAAAVGYETGRFWLLSCQTAYQSIPAATYIYNVINQTWTTCDQIFKQLIVATDDRVFGLTTAGILKVLRRYGGKADYAREYAACFVQSKVGDSSVVYFSPGAGPYLGLKAGDAIVYASIVSRIQSISLHTDGRMALQMAVESNIPNTSEVSAVLYEAYDSVIKMAPFHAGQVGREKQFAQLQIHTRQQAISRISIDYSTGYFYESDELDYKVTEIIAPAVPTGAGPQAITYGWGEGPWGLFEWGSPEYTAWSLQQESINFPIGTQPANIARVYVPLFAQRATYIQPTFTHGEALESIQIQALGWSVRGYGERTTR